MKEFSISITKPGTKKYPLHQHTHWEIMYYLEGCGRLETEAGGLEFAPGTIIIVPPKTTHGSASENAFVNISVGGDFQHLFIFDKIMVQQDNSERNGERLARLIYDNRFTNPEYLSALCNAYAHFLLINATYEKRINQEIGKLIKEITNRFSDPCFDIVALLHQSGYAEDYIRSEFKKVTSLSPIDFLTKIRIEHAKKLFEIYGKSFSVAQVAAACGFEDPVYFSRRFKQFAFVSPTEYRKQTLMR